MFLLFIIHHILNRGWYQALFKGKYTPVRILQTVSDLLLFLSMAGLMVSGIMLSNHVFAFLPIRGGAGFARLLHMAASHWGFVLMAFHLGLHWGMFLGMARKALKRQRPSAVGRIAMSVLGAVIAVYGLTVFFRPNFPTYMFLQTEFVFLDFGELPLLFYLDYLAMMGTFIFIAYYAAAFLRKRSGKKRQ